MTSYRTGSIIYRAKISDKYPIFSILRFPIIMASYNHNNNKVLIPDEYPNF